MKKFWGNTRQKMHQYWKCMMDSVAIHMSRGGNNVSKIITWARGDNWRRSQRKKDKRD